MHFCAAAYLDGTGLKFGLGEVGELGENRQEHSALLTSRRSKSPSLSLGEPCREAPGPWMGKQGSVYPSSKPCEFWQNLGGMASNALLFYHSHTF